jgi:hypothetical protein
MTNSPKKNFHYSWTNFGLEILKIIPGRGLKKFKIKQVSTEIEARLCFD